MENEAQQKQGVGDQKEAPHAISHVRDIEETILDPAFQKKKIEKVLDKTKLVFCCKNIVFYAMILRSYFVTGASSNTVAKPILTALSKNV